MWDDDLYGAPRSKEPPLWLWLVVYTLALFVACGMPLEWLQ